MGVEIHPLEPFLPENAIILFLGSFPPPRKRWSMEFYYPNFQNDFWRIMGYIFFKDKEYFITESKKTFNKDKIVTFCKDYGIALSDTAISAIRQNDDASDKFLDIQEKIKIEQVLDKIPDCRTIVSTGEKSMDTLIPLLSGFLPNGDKTKISVGEYVELEYKNRTIKLYRMPSSSRAYPKSVEWKSEYYSRLF